MLMFSLCGSCTLQLLLVGNRNDAQILPPSLTSGQLAVNGIINNIDRVLLPPQNVRMGVADGCS